ncbi:MAG: protein kinase [Polyangiaceae bacterium]
MNDAPDVKDQLGSFLAAIAEDDDDESSRRVRDRVLGAGRIIAERYKLGDRIARGGMATIWEATDTKLNRVVAIKFMGQAYTGDADYRKRFEEEARAAAQLRTPHVVAIHDHGTTEGVPFIVMERLDGEDLHQRMHRLKRLPVAFVTKVAVEASRALKVAHAAGIVHRDLKPKNLFIAKEDDEEVIKLLDFGVAKHAGTAALMTATGVMLGSPFYMSPEQIRCERNLDARTDLWSLGTILYRALTGIKAFDGDMSRVMYQITRERPRAPSAVCPDLPKALDAFFEKALATQRENRFATATEFADAFKEAAKSAGSTSVSVPPPPSSASGMRKATRPPAPSSEAETRETTETVRAEAPPPESGERQADVGAERVLGPPSDHPTFAAPVAVMSSLVQSKTTFGTGLRLAPPDEPSGDRPSGFPTPPSLEPPSVAASMLQHPPPPAHRSPSSDFGADGVALTPEQKSGFAVGREFEADARWQAYAIASSPAKSERSWGFIGAAALIVAAAIALTAGLVAMLR